MISALSAVAVLCACGGATEDAAGDATSAPTSGTATAEPTTNDSTMTGPATNTGPTGPSDTAATEPTEQPRTPQPTPDGGDPSDSRPARARTAQIPAAEMPGFNAEWTWSTQRSGFGAEPEVPSICMRASLTAIGAVTEYRTDYGSAASDDASSVQVTAVFPDKETALTASDVLRTWHDECAAHATEDLGLKRVQVSALSPVSTVVGGGVQWLTSYQPVAGDRDAVWFHAEGFVRDGDTLTYLVMTTAGQDYNYASGHAPLDRAVAVAGAALARTR